MSRVYFHTQTDTAELMGSERAWLGHIARGPAISAWDLDTVADAWERAAAIVALIPEKPDNGYGSNYLHEYAREAAAEAAANKAAYAKARETGRALWSVYPTFDHQRQLVRALKTALSVHGEPLLVAGHRLHTSDVDLNTCLATGNDCMALAAKIHGWCESHAWIEGPDRAWAADIIDRGLAAGVYRQRIDHSDGSHSTQGWEEVAALLRQADDGPAVMSYSVCDSFPNADAAGWMPAWPDGIPDDWDALTEGQQQERSDRREAWYDIDFDQKWAMAVDGLRQLRPWARISPDTLTDVTFHAPVTVYDLFAPNRDERIAAAFAQISETGSEP